MFRTNGDVRKSFLDALYPQIRAGSRRKSPRFSNTTIKQYLEAHSTFHLINFLMLRWNFNTPRGSFASLIHQMLILKLIALLRGERKLINKYFPPFLFSAPEIQISSNCSILSDMFSLGMVVCSIFNNGKPLIQAQNSPSSYLKQLELVS